VTACPFRGARARCERKPALVAGGAD
jgi:hypothetical protein